ncbi:MAG: T9SS type A sorting domain-containing protein [Prolixibacteraceae bacterium]|nr:T9SS type A sorting domain-containing protein [Prolixibacteraceae bacterium]
MELPYAPIILVCNSVTEPSCQTQEAIDEAFELWIGNIASYTGGTEPVILEYTVNEQVVNLLVLTAPDACGGIITVVVNATDVCEEVASCSAVFTVVADEEDPVFAAAPVDASYECIGDVPAPGLLAWTDNCDGEGDVLCVDASDGESCPETITRTWSYTDVCGNPASVSQIITVDDVTAPVIHAPEDYVICEEELPYSLDATWTDNCDVGGDLTAVGEWYSETECTMTYAYPFYVMDDCGNESWDTVFVTRETNKYDNCETAFARYDTDSRCFLEDGFDRWGWTNKFSPRAEPYTLTLYAGAAQCDISKGAEVGTVEVTYYDGNLTVEYLLYEGYVLSEAHVYVGCDPYPVKNESETVAPGQFTFNADELDKSSGVTINLSDVSGDIFIIAHAVTCEIICSCSEYDNADGETFDMNLGIECPGVEMESVSSESTNPIFDKDQDTGIKASSLKVFPNPFSDKVTFEFASVSDAHARLEITNLLGQRIAILMDQPVQKGVLNRIEYEPVNIISGILIYRLILDNNVNVGRIIYKKE